MKTGTPCAEFWRASFREPRAFLPAPLTLPACRDDIDPALEAIEAAATSDP